MGVHVAFEIGDQEAVSKGDVRVVHLPVIEAASIVHRGSMDGISTVYEDLIRWIEDSGLRLAGYSREFYLEMGEQGPAVTEIQVPIAR